MELRSLSPALSPVWRAVHERLSSGDGDDAVTTARFVWNGHDLLPDGE